MSALPNFWKIAKGFLDGKYKKVTLPLLKYGQSTEYSAAET